MEAYKSTRIRTCARKELPIIPGIIGSKSNPMINPIQMRSVVVCFFIGRSPSKQPFGAHHDHTKIQPKDRHIFDYGSNVKTGERFN